MSSNTAFMVLNLEGPLQSWGFDSQFNRRNTPLMPSKSGIAGMCCAALGYSRGSDDESLFLKDFLIVKMTSIAMPKADKLQSSKKLLVSRLQDFHIIKDTQTANGNEKKSHITQRFYLTDAKFGVILEGELSFVQKIAKALRNPVWGVWLGRKTCIPSVPIFAGVFDSKEDAIKALVEDICLDEFTYQTDVAKFSEGLDTISDVAISFESEARKFAVRRVKTIEGKTLL